MTKHVYKLLLWLYPSKFRRRFGAEMLDMVARYEARSGATWFLVKDLLSSLVVAHAESLKRRKRKVKRPSRTAGVLEMVSSLRMDLTVALRNLRGAPAFTAIAVVTLALGIGANTSIFSVVNGVVLKPLPYPEPDRLVAVYSIQSGRRSNMSQPDLRDIQAQTASFDALVGHTSSRFTLTGMGDAEVVRGGRLTDPILEVFGLRPVLGRDIRTEENVPGGPRVVVIGYRFWLERFGGARDVLGKTIELNEELYEIIGVAPADFDFPRDSQLWTPVYMNVEDCGRDCHFLRVLGRLAPNATLDEASEELSVLAARLEQTYPESNFEKDLVAVRFVDTIVDGNVRTALLVLLGAVGVVLLIACANVAHLQLARASARREEIAVRSALGAGRLVLFRQLLVEALVLAVLGGVAGTLLARWCLEILLELAPPELPRLHEVSVDAGVLVFTLISIVVVTLLFGLAPALAASRVSVSDRLGHRGGAGTGGPAGAASRSALLAAEVALSLVLLFAAGLLIRSFFELQAVDLGFDEDNVLSFSILLPDARYPDGNRTVAFFEALEERLKSLPEVQSLGSALGSPMGTTRINSEVDFFDRPAPPPGQEESTVQNVITPGYLETLRIPLICGRGFLPTDRRAAPPVVLINQSFADRFYPGMDPIGRRIGLNYSLGYPADEPRTIVGIVGDIRSQTVSENPEPEVYAAQAQMCSDYLTVLVRTHAGMSEILPAVRRELEALDRNVPLRGVEMLATAVNRSIGPTWFYSLLMTLFAALALVLATVGLYGVVSYLVARRTREIGIRMALGAQRKDVVSMVLTQGIRPTLAGILFGLGGAYLASRALQSMLYSVEPLDAATLVAVSGILLGTAVVATLAPARRASRIAPASTLRME
jgi:putative ABC transport system permease protein